MQKKVAWEWVFAHWHTPVWKPIPADVKSALGLDGRLGVYGGMLVSRAGSSGVSSFITRLNRIASGEAA